MTVYQEAGFLQSPNEIALPVAFVAVLASKLVVIPDEVRTSLRDLGLALGHQLGCVNIMEKRRLGFGSISQAILLQSALGQGLDRLRAAIALRGTDRACDCAGSFPTFRHRGLAFLCGMAPTLSLPRGLGPVPGPQRRHPWARRIQLVEPLAIVIIGGEDTSAAPFFHRRRS
jgi:hypothetical protein